MLDIKFIRENPDKVKEAARKKRIKADVDGLLKLDEERRDLMQQSQELRNQRNTVAKQVNKAQGEEKEKLIQEGKNLKEALDTLETQLKSTEEEYNRLMMLMPGIPLDTVPEGESDDDNLEIKKVGELPKFDFKIKDHVELGLALDIIDIERGVKLAGTRSYFLKREGALLEWAVLKYSLDKLVQKGYVPMIVPVMVKDEMMYGTGYFPGGEEQTYRMERDELNLVGTAEVSLTSYYSGETLKEEDLPQRMVALSPCFRREAGTYGKDTRGLYRIHQFNKVEQVIVCKNDPEESARMHQELLSNSEEILQELEIPYRVVTVCTGEIGQGQLYKNDIESWMPGRGDNGEYGETHSCSTFHDFQARRLNLKYKTKDKKKVFAHTLNNTAIASPRILIAIMENYQQKDGSIKIPKVLYPYMGGITVIKR